MQKIKTIIGIDIEKAAELLRSGEVVAIPTETVYGLAANALDTKAVQKIYAAKDRPANNPLIVHIGAISQMEQIASDIPEIAKKLAAAFWPGPLTLVLPKQSHIPEIVTAGLPTVGIRVPQHSLTQELLERLDFPVAAPSANPFGYISPTTAAHVARQLSGRIPYILDGGACSAGIESTIVGFEDGNAVIFRFGAIPPDEILKVALQLNYHQADGTQVLAPGMLPYHYSPQTSMALVDDLDEVEDWKQFGKVGVLSLNNSISELAASQQIQLSAKGDFKEAARNLYAALHQLDEMGLDQIIAERLPANGLGLGINDRLKRAAAKRQ